MQATLHTIGGTDDDGTCNQAGCYGNFGKDEWSRGYYGNSRRDGRLDRTIDSSRPFDVIAVFESTEDGTNQTVVKVDLRQDGRMARLLDTWQSSYGIPHEGHDGPIRPPQLPQASTGLHTTFTLPQRALMASTNHADR